MSQRRTSFYVIGAALSILSWASTRASVRDEPIPICCNGPKDCQSGQRCCDPVSAGREECDPLAPGWCGNSDCTIIDDAR